MKVAGTVKKDDIEGGVFHLVGDDGKRYAIAGGDRALRKDGQRVEVEGEIDPGAVSKGMSGAPTLRVKSWRAQ